MFDVIVFGATSFVGEILCSYLKDSYGLGGELKWAIAARSQSKLERLRKSLEDSDQGLETFLVDAADGQALTEMCQKTKVVISTVGPYSLYGETLVRVCAQNGTDYCDLTGELPWIKTMIDKYESSARSSSSRIVHSCGFDSIPSDLGVHYLQACAVKKFGRPCSEVNMRVKAIKGGASGGTIASILFVAEQAKDPKVRKILSDSYSIYPEGLEKNSRQKDLLLPRFEKNSSQWVGPFVMAVINTTKYMDLS